MGNYLHLFNITHFKNEICYDKKGNIKAKKNGGRFCIRRPVFLAEAITGRADICSGNT